MQASEIIRKAREYCAQVGITTKTLSAYATGNPRAFDQLVDRVAKCEGAAEKLGAYMEEHPDKAVRPPKGVGTDPTGQA